MVLSSTGTDIYSAVAGSIGSLKGPRHGGANIQVCHMMEEVISSIGLDGKWKHHPAIHQNHRDSVLPAATGSLSFWMASVFSAREASILDLMLVIHADHGGGNNSTFTNVVISSTGTDNFRSSALGSDNV